MLILGPLFLKKRTPSQQTPRKGQKSKDREANPLTTWTENLSREEDKLAATSVALRWMAGLRIHKVP